MRGEISVTRRYVDFLFDHAEESDMQWRRADGSTGEYFGPLFELGQGIPRNLPDHGFRRALFDLALGYVSGFPVRDIIPFAFRSLWPQKPLEANPEGDWGN
jgi:hypothetical protein